MAHRFVPYPMTLGDLEGHSPVAGLVKSDSTNICATFRTVPLTRRVPSAIAELLVGLGTEWRAPGVADPGNAVSRNGGPKSRGHHVIIIVACYTQLHYTS